MLFIIALSLYIANDDVTSVSSMQRNSSCERPQCIDIYLFIWYFLFLDISSTKLSLRIDQPFTVSLFNTKSRDYLLLKDQVTQIVRVLLGFSLYFVFGDLCIYHKAP